MFNFNRKKVNFDKELGSGAFGNVYPYQKNPEDKKWENKKWVVKNVTTRDAIRVREQVQEITLGFSCDHPSVLPVKGFFIEIKPNEGWDIFIKLPWMKSSLSKVLTKARTDNKPISEEKIVQYFYEITQGLQYLHDKGIAHRDIKPENILLDEAEAIKIADFGLGVFQIGESSYAPINKAGSCNYAAPENLNPNAELKAKNIFRADLWSLGMLLFELCTLVNPKDLKVSQLYVLQSFDQFQLKIMEQLGKIEGRYCKRLIQIISSLLRQEPEERKCLKDIQEDLLNAYGDILETKTQSKEVQTEFDMREDEIFEMRSNIEKLTKELSTKDVKLLEIEKHYKETVAKFESKLIELGIELEFERNMRRKEAEERSSRIISNLDRPNGDLPEFEPITEEDSKIITTMREFKRKWESYFIIKEDIEQQQKIAIEIKNDREIKQILDDRTIKRLMDDLCKSYSGDLKHFRLDMEGCDKVSNKSLQNVMSLLSQDFPGLRDLALRFTGNANVSDIGLQSIATYMGEHLNSLETLKLDFDRCPNISDRGINELAFKIGSNLQRLKCITFVFNSLKITDSSVRTLGSEIASNLLDLDVVNLIFKNCSCTQKGMESARKLFDNIQGVEVSLKRK